MVFGTIFDKLSRRRIDGANYCCRHSCGYDIRVDFINLPWGGVVYLKYWAIPLTIFWIVGFTNIVNLIDGLDGLAAGISFIACIAVCAMTLQLGQIDLACIALALAGATVGFLRYNF